MAATARTLSPGGALLRASRVFSLPSALPPPPGEHVTASSSFSKTATQTFPTLQTVTAPEQFRQRGDWGFKRNFPMRSTGKTSTPYLRVKQVDSMEQVTDFASASAHTLSLEKMQEMNVAISVPHATTGANLYIQGVRLRSVFEDEFDFTAFDAEKVALAGQRRWKYKGPWLANLTHGEFQDFLKKQVRGRREEFRQIVREHLAKKQTQEAVQRAMDAGTNDEPREVRPEDVTDEQITELFRIARKHKDELYGLISEFLDLAPIDHDDFDYLATIQPDQSKQLDPLDPYAKYGPPVTHPSAGLSYLRTTAYLENHPVYGPQKAHAPIKARVLGISEKPLPRAAVGGFVANSFPHISKTVGVAYESPGGTKLWAHITSAQVDSTGRAILQVNPAEGPEVSVQEEMQGVKQVFRAEAESTEPENPPEPPLQRLKSTIRGKSNRSPFKMSTSGSYGA